MLNISNNKIGHKIRTENYESLSYVENKKSGRVLIKLLVALFSLAVIFMFIPWTQNVRTKGMVTTLKPEHRPQNIQSVIGGRIETWYVKEGDFVNKGDTILRISEIKDDYFDPKLIERTQDQVRAKTQSFSSYESKVKSLEQQIAALKETAQFKLEQNRNKLKQASLKIISDSLDYQAYQMSFEIAQEQFYRIEKLYNEGLKSKTDYENRKMKMQKAKADMISAENKLLASRNEKINAQLEIISTQAQYRDDIAKAESEKFTALSYQYDADANLSKLNNQLQNYQVRTGMYYITAPLSGYVTKAMQVGIGETIKEGASIVSIMPADYDLAVAMYIRPIDFPLMKKGQKVRIQFDGWPAIVFSGWPNTSYGTYGGEVVAIDNFATESGKFRLLVKPDPDDHPWPDAIRVGAGTNNMILLGDVSIGYELWRQINGFPPNYYEMQEEHAEKK